MESYRYSSWTSFFVGFVLMIGGVSMIFSENALTENFGFILFALGGIFWGIMASIEVSARSTKETIEKTTKEITKNLIDTLKHEGLISPYSELKINKNLRVVKPVSSSLTAKYDIEKPTRRTPI